MQPVHLYGSSAETLYGVLLKLIDESGWDTYKHIEATSLAGLAHMAGDIDSLRTSLIWLPLGVEPQRLSDMVEFLHDAGVSDTAAALTQEHVNAHLEMHEIVAAAGIDMDDHYYAALLTRVLTDLDRAPRIITIVRERGPISMGALDEMMSEMDAISPSLIRGLL